MFKSIWKNKNGKIFVALFLTFAFLLLSSGFAEAVAPTVITGAATSITKTSAVLAGSIANNGGEIITDTGFQFGLTASYGQTIASTDNTTEFSSKFGSFGSGNGQFANPFDIEFDSAGNIYVLELDNSRVQKFNSAGVYQSQFGTSGVGDGQFQFPRGLGIDSDDNIYVADLARVQKFNSSGVYQSQLTGSFTNPYDVGIDSSDNVYVVDTGEQEIDIYNSAGVFQSTIGASGSGNGEFNDPMFIAFDSLGNFFVTDFGNHRVQKFNSAGVYQSQFGTTGSGNGQFSYIRGIDINSEDYIYVSDIDTMRVQKFNSAGVYQSQFGSLGSSDGQFNGPYGVKIDSLDAIYVADSLNNRIQKLTEQFSASLNAVVPALTCGTTYHYRAYGTNASGTSYGNDATFTTLACEDYLVRTGIASSITDTTVSLTGSHEGEGSLNITSRGFEYGATTSYGQSSSEAGDLFIDDFGSSGGGGGNGSFVFLNTAGTDTDGNIYTTDQFEDVVQKFDSSGNFVDQYNVSAPAPGGVTIPSSVRGAPDGKIYIVDFTNSQIVRFDDNDFTNPTLFAAGAGLSSPTDIAFDSGGGIYVADYGNNRIVKLNSSGAVVLEIGEGTGSGDGEFTGVASLGIDSSGNIYAVDSGNNRIQKFNASGAYVGQVGIAGSGNGEFGFSMFSFLSVDENDYVYVADTSNNRIQKFNSSLVYQSQFGVSGTGNGEFSSPASVAIGADGSLIVSDSGNNRIQIFNENFSRDISGLTCGTTYHYRATASGPDGTETGDDDTFTTSACPGGSSGGGGSSGTHFICIDPLALNYTNDLAFGKINNKICRYPKKDTPPNELSCNTPIYLTRPVKYTSINDPADVKLLEKYLNTYEGYSLPVDGIYAKPDFDAVVKWQEKYYSEILKPWGLAKGTGYVFLTSLKKIKSIHEAECAKQGTASLMDGCYLYDQKLKRGDNNNFVKFAQKALRASGSLAGTADGKFGPATELAVKDFQKKNNLYADGIIGATTGKKLEGVKCSI